MAEHMRAELVVEALEMALWQRRPDVGLVHHSDRGGQYVSLIFGQTARAAGIDVSMGAKGCALDNAVCESVLRHAQEGAHAPTLLADATRARRAPCSRGSKAGTTAAGLHSTLGYLSPAHYENRTLGQRGAGLAASRLAHTSEMIKEKAA